MAKPIVLIGIPGSVLLDETAARLGGAPCPRHTLSIDAPLEGKPVTIARGVVSWEGVDLSRAGVIFVERPVFPWPQLLLPTGRFRPDLAYEHWIVFQREAVSLIVSALSTAAESRPVLNPPAAAHMAVAPSIALDRLAGNGIPVHSWRMEPAPSPDRHQGGFVLDACGRDRWYAPRRPQAGGASLVIEPFDGEVAEFVVVGGKPAGALRCPGGEAWARWHGTGWAAEGSERSEIAADTDRPQPLDDARSLPDAAKLAGRAAAALGLDVAAVSVRAGASPPSVLLCEAGPDLEAWNVILNGRVAAALADHLASVAST